MTRFFAEIDETNTVLRVIGVDEKDCLDNDGNFSEAVAVTYICSVYKEAVFLESRTDGSIRRFHADVGGTYVTELDEFRPPQPEGWIWNDEEGRWEDPNPVEPEAESDDE